PPRQIRNGGLDVVPGLPLVDALGRTPARRVGIERQDETLGEALQQPNMVFRERGTARRHRARDAGERETDDIGVALAYDCLANVCNIGLRPIESVEDSRLRIDDGFVAGVLVLRAVVPRQDPATESGGIAPLVERGDQHTTPKRVALTSTRVHITEASVSPVLVGQ